ncbi:MAG: helix-turn-helix transcriptional regulator [Anaerolineae bacterium]|nr:helix-turn-helix transcriptional regulator [Anaerolineae bacterium]
MVRPATGYRAQAKLFRALAHPARLWILDILACQEACVCHLTAVLGQRQPYVSQQLAILREAGLVTDRRDGTLVYYRLADKELADLLERAKALARELSDGELIFPPVSKGPVANCPCPRCQGEG